MITPEHSEVAAPGSMWKHPRLKYVGLYLLGVATGCVVSWMLWMNTADRITQILRVPCVYELEERMLTIEAQDPRGALELQRQIVGLRSRDRSCLSPKGWMHWHLPFTAALAPLVGRGEDYSHEGLYRVRLARRLEEAGQLSEANTEYARAGRILDSGHTPEEIRMIGATLVNLERKTHAGSRHPK